MIKDLGLKEGDEIEVRFDKRPLKGWFYIITRLTDDEILCYDVMYSIDEPYTGGLIITNDDISTGRISINEKD